MQFGARLYEMLRQALSESVVLARYCLVGGMPALSRLVQNRLVSIKNISNITVIVASSIVETRLYYSKLQIIQGRPI